MPRQYTRDGLSYARSALHLAIPTWEAMCSAIEHSDSARAERQLETLQTWLNELRKHLAAAARRESRTLPASGVGVADAEGKDGAEGVADGQSPPP
jgi:hypothetical protein